MTVVDVDAILAAVPQAQRHVVKAIAAIITFTEAMSLDRSPLWIRHLRCIGQEVLAPPPRYHYIAPISHDRKGRPLRSVRGKLRPVFRNLGFIALFSLPSVAIFWHMWSGHLASTATCACSDSGQQIWFMAWPAYALLHGLNPLFSGVVWTPKGTNLLVNASSPLIGLVLAPLTWAWGPVASTNLALTLAPGLSTWACWIACRRLVTWPWAALVGAALFGYSPFVLSSICQGHLSLGFLMIPPLILVLLDEILSKQTRPAWISGLALGLLVVAQFLISPEVLVMTSVVSVIGIFVAALLAGFAWFKEHLLHVLKASGIAAAVAAALLAYPVWFALAGPRHIVGSVWPGLNFFGNRLNDIWAPDSLASDASAGAFGPAGHSLADFGLTGPNPAYLGFGVLAIVFLAVVVAWRRTATWALLATGIGSLVLSLGSAGFRKDVLASFTWLPWQSLVKWPVLDDVLPGRFALLTELAASVLVAIGIDEARQRLLTGKDRRGDPKTAPRHALRGRTVGWRAQVVPIIVLCAVAAVVLVPIWRFYPIPTSTETIALPPWFETAALDVPNGSVILTYPFPASASLASEPMIWQAVDDMHFSLAGGYVKVPGADGQPFVTGPAGSATNSLIMLTISKQTPSQSWVPTSADLVALRNALTSWKVSYIVITATGPNPVFTAAVMTAVTGHVPQVSHQAWVWNLRSPPLGGSFDAAAAASAFGSCRLSAVLYVDLSRGEAPPQGANTCISNKLSESGAR